MTVTISEIDQQFLKSIEGNARLSDGQLASMLGCDVDNVIEIRARLEALGVITGYRTRIKWDVVTTPAVESFIDLAVQPERGYGYDRIADRIKQFPEVVSVHLVTGSQDLRVVVRGQTMQDVASFVAERLATIDGVRGTATRFVLKCYKQEGDAFARPGNDERLAVAP
jgi:DNA-binding Lrp family transcriptional regulator